MALSGLFWTGFYQRDVLERTNDARKQYSIDVTYAHVQDGKHIPVDDVLDVIDGIDEMPNSGKPQKAMSYIQYGQIWYSD